MSILETTAHTLEEARLLGPRRLLFRLQHEASQRMGLFKHTQPIQPPGSPSWKKSWCGEQNEKELISFWRKNHPPFFLDADSIPPISERLKNLWTPSQMQNLLEEAEAVRRGNIRLFSRWSGDFGDPIDWHLNPQTGKRWPSGEHWSRVLRHERTCGDVRLTWELGRFPHAYTLVRAWVVTQGPVWVRTFFKQLETWENENHYRAGIHWVSGQEAAIRSCGWLFALYAFGHSPEVQSSDLERLLRLLFLHAQHIESNINYARLATHNNHLIGEALGLYLLGALLPWFKESPGWKSLGRKLLTEECPKQFYPDGGYCQSSHMYQRLALNYYVWALRCAECLGEPFPKSLYEMMSRSRDYILSFMNEDGFLPNWGANDSSLLNPWTHCDRRDFRPLLESLTLLTQGQPLLENGPWKEEILWLWGPSPLDRSPVKKTPASASFPVSGLHVLRQSPGDFIVLRCGDVQDRFGQADQLHVDLWWKGMNITQDGGSYLYNDQLEYHRYFMGTKSHNTILVEEKDQMVPIRRFKWLYWTKASLNAFIPYGPVPQISGTHFGYQRLPGKIKHTRSVKALGPGEYEVKDILEPADKQMHHYTLHWLIGPWEIETLHETPGPTLLIKTPRGLYTLKCHATSPESGTILNLNWDIVRGQDSDPPRGWISPYYGEKLAAWSLLLRISARGALNLETEFHPQD